MKNSKRIVMDGVKIETVGKVGNNESSKSTVMDGDNVEKLGKLANMKIARAS